MKRWKEFVTTLTLLVGVGMGVAAAPTASAIDVLGRGCQGNADSTVCKSRGDNATSMIRIVINTALVVLGMVAVVMIVIGGIRYASSGGDASAVKGAKDTILYSVVGLVIAIMSFTIVNFVLNWF